MPRERTTPKKKLKSSKAAQSEKRKLRSSQSTLSDEPVSRQTELAPEKKNPSPKHPKTSSLSSSPEMMTSSTPAKEARVRFETKSAQKRKRDMTEEGDVIPLECTGERRVKMARKNDKQVLNPVALKARRTEARKLKKKVRQMKSRGKLPEHEKEAVEVGVMYLGHIPHGFYEDEMRAYFSQFGEVTRVRLSRSRRTARSRGFAFLEFADKVVAAAAADSMDGYLMHGQALVAKLMVPEMVHPATFKGANRVFKKIPFSAVERRGLIQRSRDPVKLALRSRTVAKNAKAKQEKLSRKGIRYEYPSIASDVKMQT